MPLDFSFKKDSTTSSTQPQARVTSGQKPKSVTPYCQLLCDCPKYLLKRNHFLQHQMSKTKFEVHKKHLKTLHVIAKNGIAALGSLLPYPREIISENGVFTLKTHQRISLCTMPKKFGKATVSVHLG